MNLSDTLAWPQTLAQESLGLKVTVAEVGAFQGLYNLSCFQYSLPPAAPLNPGHCSSLTSFQPTEASDNV